MLESLRVADRAPSLAAESGINAVVCCRPRCTHVPQRWFLFQHDGGQSLSQDMATMKKPQCNMEKGRDLVLFYPCSIRVYREGRLFWLTWGVLPARVGELNY